MNLTVFQPNVGDMVGKAQQIAAQGQQMRQQAQLRDFYAKEGPGLFPNDPTLGKLAAVDPGQAFQLAQYKQAGEQQRMQQFEAIAQRLSKAVLGAPDNVKPAMYAQAVKLLGEQGLDVSRLPQWGPEAQALVSLYAMPAAERTEFERLLSAMSPEEAAKAIRIRAGIEPGADTVFKAETRPAPNAPSGYQWIDPADPSKGVRMIPGIQEKPSDLERRAVAAGLQPGTPEYQEFMLRGGKVPEAPQPSDAMAKLRSDLANGFITQEEFDARARKLTETGPLVQVSPGETEYDKQRGKDFAAQMKAIEDNAAAAVQTMQSLDLMESAARDPNFYSGAGAETLIIPFKQFAAALGVNPQAVSSIETFRAESYRAALAQMGGSLGAGFSNADRDFVERQVPNLANTPEGNLRLIEVLRKVQERKIEIARMAREYEAAVGRLDPGFLSKLQDYAVQNPLFGTAPAAPGPAAPRQSEAPDILKRANELVDEAIAQGITDEAGIRAYVRERMAGR